MADGTAVLEQPKAARLRLPAVLPAIDNYDVTVSATLLTLVLYSSNTWYVRGPVLALGAVGFLLKGLRQKPFYWFSCLALSAGYVFVNYHSADNHKFLLCYWLLALCACLHSAQPRLDLAASARWLIMLTMALAVFWKVVSPDYLNGEFFAHELLYDPRFRVVARLFGGATPEIFEANRMAVEQLKAGLQDSPTLQTAPGIERLAEVLAWSGLVGEGTIALAFLAPTNSWLGRVRDVPLIAFIVFVYPVATVMGFAYLLAVMGLAQASSRAAKLAYVALFAALQLYTVNWGIFL